MIDAESLTAWLTDRAKSNTPLVGAIYQGLIDRIRRGEFDATTTTGEVKP